MDANHIFQKTSLGLQEVSSRTLRLAPKLRTMLILVDGSAPAQLLKEKAELIGAPADFMEQLLKAGLIVSSTAGSYFATDAALTTARV
jgi:hypothetical protein